MIPVLLVDERLYSLDVVVEVKVLCPGDVAFKSLLSFRQLTKGVPTTKRRRGQRPSCDVALLGQHEDVFALLFQQSTILLKLLPNLAQFRNFTLC
jgi:hypothetical protein